MVGVVYGNLRCESSLNAPSHRPASAASNLCGRGVGALAAGGRSDAVSQEDLLGVLQNGLVAELQVELEEAGEEIQLMTSSIGGGVES